MIGKTVDGAKGPPLCQRMIYRIRTANLAQSTCIGYIDRIEPLARHYNASPDDLGSERVNQGRRRSVWVTVMDIS